MQPMGLGSMDAGATDAGSMDAGPMGAEAAGAPLVLASGSQWRRGLLDAAGIPAEALAPDVDEDAIQHADPVELARLRAAAKAEAVAALRPGCWVVGADQVVHLDGVARGKPRDADDWRRGLASLRGRVHQLSTAVTLIGPDGMAEHFVEHSEVRFRSDLSDADLEAYIALGEAKGCAGGYMVEGRGAWLVESVDGDWTNVVGLPIFALIGRLRARGWRLGAGGRAAAGGLGG